MGPWSPVATILYISDICFLDIQLLTVNNWLGRLMFHSESQGIGGILIPLCNTCDCAASQRCYVRMWETVRVSASPEIVRFSHDTGTKWIYDLRGCTPSNSLGQLCRAAFITCNQNKANEVMSVLCPLCFSFFISTTAKPRENNLRSQIQLLFYDERILNIVNLFCHFKSDSLCLHTVSWCFHDCKH